MTVGLVRVMGPGMALKLHVVKEVRTYNKIIYSCILCILACTPLNNPYDGRFDCLFGEVAHYKDICNFTCNTGYELTGSDSRTCQSDGNWSGTETTCSELGIVHKIK